MTLKKLWSYGRVATIPEKVTPTQTPAKSGSELSPATPTQLKSRNLPYIVEPNPESDSDSFWENSQLQATPTPGIVATLSYGNTELWLPRFRAHLLHGEDGPGDELPVVADREVPRADAHHVVERELHDQPTLRVHLSERARNLNLIPILS